MNRFGEITYDSTKHGFNVITSTLFNILSPRVVLTLIVLFPHYFQTNLTGFFQVILYAVIGVGKDGILTASP